MNVLITGGAGFIGSNIALKLIAKGYGVTVLDSQGRCKQSFRLGKGACEY